MPTRRSPEQNLESAREQLTIADQPDTEPPPGKPEKVLTPMQHAAKVQTEIAKVNKRERDAISKARARYQFERMSLTDGLPEKVVKILEAPAEEEQA